MGRLLLLLLSCRLEVVVLGGGGCHVEGETGRGGVEGMMPLPSGSILCRDGSRRCGASEIGHTLGLTNKAGMLLQPTSTAVVAAWQSTAVEDLDDSANKYTD